MPHAGRDACQKCCDNIDWQGKDSLLTRVYTRCAINRRCCILNKCERFRVMQGEVSGEIQAK